ncbi:MAG: AAA family ATPase, partial [Atopobiaceae bacterium]|nr:AAA family ATPase [Atopobiaceae bacterium]
KSAAQGRKDAADALKRVESQLSKPPSTPAATSSGTTPASTSSPTPARKPVDPEKEVERLLAELDALTGLKGVKREIRRRVASVRLSKLRGDEGGHGSLHMVFAGNPGTGKTTVARLVGRIYHALGLIRDGDLFVECSREDLVAGVIGQTALNTKAMIDKALGGILFIDEAYALYKAESEKDFGTEAIDTLVKAMEDHRDDLVVIMAGYTEEMRTMVREANPGLASRFRTWVEFEDYTTDELLEIATKMLDDRGREMGAGVEEALHDLIASRYRDSSFGNARGVRNLLDDVQDVMDERLARRLEEGDKLDESELRLVSSGDIERLIGQPGDGGHVEESLDNLLAELDSLTGLSSAKRAIRIRVAQVKHAARAKAVGAAVSTDASSLHMVFAGNPGTGKTTVARLVGRIYHALGIVRDAHRFVECKREDLVGQYIGQTAPKVKAVIERALGGVLFIDEAYSLFRPGAEKDFGAEAIDALVALMEDHRDDLVVIMAGYSNEMHAMIEGANPGLKSRFRTWIEFEDYTTDELAEIFQGMAAARGLRLEDGCEALLLEAIGARVSLGDFGNARGVRNLLDDIVERQVLRLAEEGDAAERAGRTLSKEEFETIRAVDIPPAPKAPSKARMGFA